MKKLIFICFDKFWRPLLFFIISLVFVILTWNTKNQLLANISISVFLLSLSGLLFSAIYQFLKKRWIKGIVTVLTFFLSIAGIFMYTVLMLFIETIDGDHWADNLKIPSNILIDSTYYIGSEHNRPDSIINLRKTKTDFQLYESFQPGLYEYDFWTNKLESGSIYLKAFEITQSYPLSADRLADDSKIIIVNKSDSIIRFESPNHFTIYEGDWGKPYAARFEVWFKPAKNGNERKLYEKNFIIEGWQR